MELTESVLRLIADKPADDIRIGPRYTAVRVGQRIGLARTMGAQFDAAFDAGRLIKKRVARLVSSERLIEASIGAAAINAQIKPTGNMTVGNVFERILEVAGRFESKGVVGRFPFAEQLKGTVHVFEEKPLKGCLPASEAEVILPECDLVVITGSAFINKTLEHLLEISTGYTMVIGPSTPLSPVLFEFGADLLAGIACQAEQVLDIVGKGGGTRDFIGFAQSIIMEPG